MDVSLLQGIDDAIRAVSLLKEKEALFFMKSAVDRIVNCFLKGGKLLIAGNGGSLCDAMHFAEELTGQFREKRMALPAIALSDPGHMSCVGNDHGFDSIFSRGVEAFGKKEDLFILLSTSGNSTNLVQAAKVAKEKGLATIAFLGKTGGQLKGVCDVEWIVSGFSFSDRIQEAHMAAIHLIIEQVEKKLFYSDRKELKEVLVSYNINDQK